MPMFLVLNSKRHKNEGPDMIMEENATQGRGLPGYVLAGSGPEPLPGDHGICRVCIGSSWGLM